MPEKDINEVIQRLQNMQAVLTHYDELWDKLTIGVDTQLIGSILFNHLLVEHYMDDYIKGFLPPEFDIDRARLTFAQKMNLLENDTLFTTNQMKEGVMAINSIRNGLAHVLNKPIEQKHLETLVKVIKTATKKSTDPLPTINDSPEKIIQVFAAIFSGSVVARMIELTT
jgi:hypothetical protein